jgi:DNA-binding transcriptional regulator YiaG
MSTTKPKHFMQSGKEAKLLRNKLGLNQSEFWRRISVTHSGGSRYESGRNLPKPVQLLLHLAYAPEK